MKIKYIALCLLLALVGCQRDEEMEIGQVSVSNERLEASYSSVEISCTFQTNVTIKNVKAYLSTTEEFSSATSYSLTEKAKNTFGANIEGLKDASTYYVRYEISNRWSSKMVDDVSEFNTIPYTTPTVQTNEVTDVTYNSAKVSGTIAANGGKEIKECGIVYSTNQNPTTANNKVTSGSGLGQFTCNLTDLQDGTTYYARAYAINEKGTAYGEEVSFTTKQLFTPTIVTTQPTNVAYNSATVGGNVTNDGGAEITERGICYSTSTNPTIANTKISNGSGIGAFTCNLTDLQNETTYYVRAYAVNAKGTAYGEEVSFTTLKAPFENGHEYIDLGLSVKWATMNVGANSPEEHGDYFAWGETEPKETYDWSTYKWCNGSHYSLTKYNTDSSYGTVDNKTTLELNDDAARANWGGSWRMPTDAEMTELRTNCTWTWTTENGVNGYKVTSKSNGNSIFLPAAGYRGSGDLIDAGSYGGYWSSSLNSDYPIHAYVLFFGSGNVDRGSGNRYYGHSVRPVCP